MKHRVFLIAAALCVAVACLSISVCGEDSASSNQADTVKTSERDTSSAPVQSAARPDLNDPEQRAGQNVKDHLKVLYESANIIVTITPPDINQFSEGNIKLLDKSNQNKILWEMTIPSQKLSGIGTGAIKSTAFFEDNKRGIFYAAIIRNELFPEVVILKIDSKNETVSESRFASPFLPDLPFKKMKLNVVQNIVLLSVTYIDNKHQESAIDISYGEADAIEILRQNPTLRSLLHP
ncbi:MAG: hypothetical protein PUC15_07385 [Lentisphaeria bacterium]|nr:hypothetical protein [Lentisphaeria bacterium]